MSGGSTADRKLEQEKIAYTILQAAQATGASPDLIRQAIKTTAARSFPPPLRAKRLGMGLNARYLTTRKELEEWMDRLPDA